MYKPYGCSVSSTDEKNVSTCGPGFSVWEKPFDGRARKSKSSSKMVYRMYSRCFVNSNFNIRSKYRIRYVTGGPSQMLHLGIALAVSPQRPLYIRRCINSNSLDIRFHDFDFIAMGQPPELFK